MVTWQALNKKENKGGESPELETVLTLTPRTEEKYKQINEEFDQMIKTHKIPVSTGVWALCRRLLKANRMRSVNDNLLSLTLLTAIVYPRGK